MGLQQVAPKPTEDVKNGLKGGVVHPVRCGRSHQVRSFEFRSVGQQKLYHGKDDACKHKVWGEGGGLEPDDEATEKLRGSYERDALAVL